MKHKMKTKMLKHLFEEREKGETNATYSDDPGSCVVALLFSGDS